MGKNIKITKDELEKLILEYGKDILDSPGMHYEKTQKQHGNISCFEHSVAVAYISIWLARKLHFKVELKSLIRGALLHDYFLYDWRVKKGTLHGFTHARTALDNARKDFSIGPIEEDIILKHMFPLNIMPPRFKESFIVCLADKISAALELSSLIVPLPTPGVKWGKSFL